MPFLALSNADIKFDTESFTWKSYSATKALLTTRQVELIDKHNFAKAALDENSETFVVHVAALGIQGATEAAGMPIHPDRANQVQVAALQQDKAPTEIPPEYTNYANVFSPDLAMELPENTGINEHVIELIEGKKLPYGPIYSLGPVELETLKAYSKTHLKTGFIWPSKFLADAPIYFDKKPDGSFSLYVDYRRLNCLTIKNWYPLPVIGESLDRLGRTKRFTQLDLTSAYYWIRIQKGDKWKTAFRTRYGHFKYQVMPFGLSNAPASFQGYINKILAEKLDIFVIVYIDNILIYTKDPGQSHVDAVCWVLEQFRKHGLFANLKKCRFYQDEVRLLGFVVSVQGINIEEERIMVVKTWPEPKSIRNIQVFLRFANFYQRFIQGFSKIVTPLTSILKITTSSSSDVEKTPKAPGNPNFLTPEAKLAFSQLRQAFTEAPILHYFDPERYIRIETDASDYAIGGIFS